MANQDLSNKSVNIYIDNQAAETALADLQVKADKFSSAIESARKKQKQLNDEIANAKVTGQSYSAQEKALKKVSTEIAKNETALKKATEAQQKLQQQIASGVGPSLRQQEQLVQRLTREYKNMAAGTAEAESKLQELGKSSKVLDEMKGRLDAVTNAQRETAKGTNFLASFFGNLASTILLKASSAITGFFKDAFDEAIEAEEKTARLKNTLDNLGRSDVFDRMISKANEMADRFSYLDNDDVTGVFEHLIDYGKLTERQINELLPVIINFAAKQRISLDEAATTLSKFIETGRGLKGFGLDTKDASSETERLSLVMGDLADKVNGAADAFQKTSAGIRASTQQDFKNLKEDLGNELLPAFTAFLGFITKAIQGVKMLASDIKNLFLLKGFVIDEEKLNAQVGYDVALKEIDEDKKLLEKVNASTQTRISVFDEQITRSKELISKYEALIEESKYDPVGVRKSLNNQLGAKLKDREEVVAQLQLFINTRNTVIKGYQNELALLKNQQVLGEASDIENKEEEKKRAEAAAKEAEKRRQEEFKKLQEFIQKIDDLYLKSQARSEIEKDLSELAVQFSEIRRQAAEVIKDEKLQGQQLLRVEEIYQIERAKIILKYGDLAKKEHDRLYDEVAKKQDKLLKDSKHIFSDLSKRLQEQSNTDAANANQRRDINKLAGAELAVMQAGIFKKLRLEKDFLDEQRRQALQNASLTENQKALIEEQFRQAKMSAELNFWTNIFNQAMSIFQDISSLFTPNEDVQKAREEKELAQLQKTNDRKKASDQKLLNGQLISRQEFNRRSKILDDNYAAQAAATKKKQWERQQQADLLAAKISGAQAVLSALQTKPFYLGLALAIVAALKTKKEIDTIKNMPVPEFAKGDMLRGPSHRDGGIDMVDSRTGKKVAEAEGGEVLLSKKTVKRNPELIGTLLRASQKTDGIIQPPWRSRPYQAVDYNGIIASSRRMKYYESGGVVTETLAAAQDSTPPAQPAVLPDVDGLSNSINSLNQTLQQPVRAFVIYKDIENAKTEIDNIRNDAVFR